MNFTPTKLDGATIVELKELCDERGFFARSWCQKEFQEHGLSANVVQANISYNKLKGTLRGMHYQVGPYEESKLVRCTQGAIYDVIIDLRQGSPTFKQWLGVELSAANHRMLFVPEGFAHGFVSLTDESEVTYQVTQFYHPASERGVRYNDPSFGVVWPIPVAVISEKDRSWPDYLSV